jgi:predicted ribosome quality control (RQC) complex YloA/Tae2 family protein
VSVTYRGINLKHNFNPLRKSKIRRIEMDENVNELLIKDVSNRVTKLEEKVKIMKGDIEQKNITHEQITKTLEIVANAQHVMVQGQGAMQIDIREIRVDMLNLVTETLNRTRLDMSSFIKTSEKSEEKVKDHDRKSSDAEKRFYRKLIVACVAILGTIVLSFFGIKAIIPLF